jgi:hypothetical protein
MSSQDKAAAPQTLPRFIYPDPVSPTTTLTGTVQYRTVQHSSVVVLVVRHRTMPYLNCASELTVHDGTILYCTLYTGIVWMVSNYYCHCAYYYCYLTYSKQITSNRLQSLRNRRRHTAGPPGLETWQLLRLWAPAYRCTVRDACVRDAAV